MNTGQLKDTEVYRIALDTRNLEINLFWQRSNYFLALNTALAVGFFSIQGKSYPVLLAVLGILVSILWYRVNLGSKYWQTRWEQRLKIVEKQIAPEINFFAADGKTIQEDVQQSIRDSNYSGLQKYLYDRVLNKPSVSYMMTLLSLVFVFVWAILIPMAAFK